MREARTEGPDWIYFVVRFQGGSSARIRVQRFVLNAFNNSVITIVRDRQERGVLPPGPITSIERVGA